MGQDGRRTSLLWPSSSKLMRSSRELRPPLSFEVREVSLDPRKSQEFLCSLEFLKTPKPPDDPPSERSRPRPVRFFRFLTCPFSHGCHGVQGPLPDAAIATSSSPSCEVDPRADNPDESLREPSISILVRNTPVPLESPKLPLPLWRRKSTDFRPSEVITSYRTVGARPTGRVPDTPATASSRRSPVLRSFDGRDT